jgi:PST family polysaccharide transporter
MYVSFILGAMATDFYPRLTAIATDNVASNRLVNEQTEIGLLIGSPGVLATLTFAPLVIFLFYSSKFGPAVEILRWNCLGMLLRVASWPLSYVLLAKGEMQLFLWIEILKDCVQLALIWICLLVFGLIGTGVASFVFDALSLIAMNLVVRRLTGFRLSDANRHISLLTIPVCVVVFVSWYCLPTIAFTALSLIGIFVTSMHSFSALSTMIPADRLPSFAKRLLPLFNCFFHKLTALAKLVGS